MESQDYLLSKDRSENRQVKIHLKRSWILGFLVLLLWLAPTIRWRIDFGVFSYAFLEPIVIFVIVLLLLSRKNSSFSINVSIIVLLLFFTWILAIRPWSEDWKHGLSDLRDWMIPIITFCVLLSTVKRGWKNWTLIMVPVVVINACLGIFQVVTDSSRPFASAESLYKLDLFSRAIPSFAVGFFEHPNSLAVYLIVAIMVSIGWFEDSDTLRGKLLPVVIVILLTLTLYWTYAKAEIYTIALMIFFYFAIPFIKSSRTLISISFAAVFLTLGAGWLAMNRWPVEFNTIWWRVSLWESTVQTISENPGILIWGNGEIAFASKAIWSQPHNILFDIILKYGLVGLLLLSLLLIVVIIQGTESFNRGDFKRFGILRASWVSIYGFLITGLVESSLIGIETRMLFLLLIACFIGLSREIPLANISHWSQQSRINFPGEIK